MYAAVPLQTGRARAPTCLFCVRVCVAGASLDLSCGASCGTPAVGIVTNCALRNVTNQNQNTMGRVATRHTHATRHARVSCVFVRGACISTVHLRRQLRQEKRATHESPPHPLSLSQREREKMSVLGSCVSCFSSQIGLRLFRRGHLKPVSKGSQRTHLSLSLLLRGRGRETGCGQQEPRL